MITLQNYNMLFFMNTINKMLVYIKIMKNNINIKIITQHKCEMHK